MTKETFENARPRRGGFTTVVNPMLDDRNLNLEAKGLLTILVSNSNAWDLNMKELFNRSGNGRDVHYNVINELILEGYFCRLYILKEHNKHEEVIYIFSDDKEHVTNRTNELIDKKKKEGKKIIVENYLSKRFYTKKFPKKLALRVEKKLKELEAQGLFPLPEFQDAEQNEVKNPLPEFQDTEIPDTGFQDNNNTKGNKTNLNNTNNSMYVCIAGPESPSINLFKENYKLSKYAKEKLESFSMKYGEELTLHAVQKVIKNTNVTNEIAYIKGTLENWATLRLKTVDEIISHEKSFYEAKKAPKQKKGGQQKGKKPVAKPTVKKEKLPATIAGEIVNDETDEETKAIYDDIFATMKRLRSTEDQVIADKNKKNAS